MGLQTQVGTVKITQLHRLELPVMVGRGSHYALITDVGKEKVLLADPEQGWQEIPMEDAKTEWGNDVQVVLLKRLQIQNGNSAGVALARFLKDLNGRWFRCSWHHYLYNTS